MVQKNQFNKILVFHPGAIGDVMLATPVAAILKRNYPAAKLDYWTHASLAELFKLTNFVDEVLVYNKTEGIFAQRKWLKEYGADLIVDLSGSLRSHLLTLWLGGAKVVHYRKQSPKAFPMMHAVDNFLQTLKPLGLDLLPNPPANPSSKSQADIDLKYFPTLTPPLADMQLVGKCIGNDGSDSGKKLIGIVPGVGKLRSHRAWAPDKWKAFISKLKSSSEWIPVLIGGTDEQSLCNDIASDTGVKSLAGVLSLPQTAALLKLCKIVVSGDTGPAHLSVAVGTPVIGLYGPTFPARSGPYGCAKLLIDVSDRCSCHAFKSCRVVSDESACMQQISVDDVMAKLSTV